MPTRRSQAQWNGKLKDGSGKIKLASGAYEGNYSFSSRFEDGSGTNPEELIAAAHAGCFSMALAHSIEEKGYNPQSVKTSAAVKIEQVDDGFAITEIKLTNESNIPGIDEKEFQDLADAAKTGCPVSKALAAVDIKLDAKLVS